MRPDWSGMRDLWQNDIQDCVCRAGHLQHLEPNRFRKDPEKRRGKKRYTQTSLGRTQKNAEAKKYTRRCFYINSDMVPGVF